MSEFETYEDNEKRIEVSNETDSVYFGVRDKFLEISDGSSFPAIIPLEKWEAYRAEIDNIVAKYRDYQNKQS